MKTYKYWKILDELPQGWIIDKTAGSPLHNCVFITNGKSVLRGQKRALLKVYEPKDEQQELKFPEAFKKKN